MRYWNILAILLVVFICIAHPVDEVQYGGLRVDLSGVTFNRDILACVIPGLNHTRDRSFKSISQPGPYSAKLNISKIEVTNIVINEDLFDMLRVRYKESVYELNGLSGSISFAIRFEYSVSMLGFIIASDAGSGTISNTVGSIFVLFNETRPNIQIPNSWNISKITIPWNLVSPAKWVQALLESQFLPEFAKVVDDSMFGFSHKLLAAYEQMGNAFYDGTDLVFYNFMTSVKSTVGGSYLSIAFGTNVTVNGVYTRKLYRRMTGTAIPMDDLSICFAAQLVPDTLDVLGKGGYYPMEVRPELWGFDNATLWTLFPILPSLKEVYTGDEEYLIACDISRSLSTNDLSQRGSSNPRLEFQYPLVCRFILSSTRQDLLRADLFTRMYYEMVVRDHAFFSHCIYAETYEFGTYPVLPIARREILARNIKQFTTVFNEATILSPGIKPTSIRAREMTFARSYTKQEEICFSYRENRH